MKKQMSLSIAFWSLLLVFIGFGAVTASAATQPPNLRVLLTGPSSAQVRSPYLYTVNVKNIGGSTAAGVTVVVDLPETNTSPQKYILGTLSGIDSRCQVVARKLNCALGNITKSGVNQTKIFTFTLVLPVSTRTLEIKATASTATNPETNPLNNVASIIPTPAYATNQITSANVLVTNCTGTGLSSFFECELFSGSTQSFSMTLNADQSITIPGYPDYTGQWDQLQTTQQPYQQLHFTITEIGTGDGAEFTGFATTNTCFEGLTTFIPTSNYVSPYKVCVQ